MTPPDVFRKRRNMFGAIAATLLTASFGAAYAAELWTTVFDYWLIWAAIFTGGFTIAACVATVICEVIRVDELRSN